MGVLEGLSAFVAGGGTDIGLACARRIVAEGGRVAIGGRRTEVLVEAAQDIGTAAVTVPCDITDDQSVRDAMKFAIERNGPLRLAVNSAYQAMVGSALAMTTGLFAMTLNGTLTGTYRAMQAQAKAMIEAGGGSIVNISSVAAVSSGRWESAYGAAKAGVDVLTRAAGDEWGRYGIRVNSVLPGLVRTETAAPLTEDPATRGGFIRQTPLARLGEVEDIASGVVFLLSDAAAFVTGQSLCIDGGLSLRGIPEPEHGQLFKSLIPDLFAENES